MVILPNEYDPFQVFLTRTSYKKWEFAVIHSYRSHDQLQVDLHVRDFFVMSHLKLKDEFSPTTGEFMGTLTIQRAIERHIHAGDGKPKIGFD